MSNTGPAINLGAQSVLYAQGASNDPHGSGNTRYSLFFATLALAQLQITIANLAGWRSNLEVVNNYFTVDLDIGYNTFLPNNASSEAEPLSVWTVSPNYVEKPLLESGIPVVKNLSIATKEKIIAALKNPGKNIIPAAFTSELPQALSVYNLMRAGTEKVPYSTVTVSRKIRVSKFYISQWSFADANNLNVLSKNYLIGKCNMPEWVQAVIPPSFTEDLGNGIVGFWGYREVREPYQEAPDNQIAIGQSFVYDRWITSIGNGFTYYNVLN